MQKVVTYILSLLFFSVPATFFAQGDFGMHFMPGLVQSQYTNPAFMSKKRISIGLPGVALGASHNGFTLNDLLTPVQGTDSLRVDIDNVLNQMQDDNTFHTQVQADVLTVGVRIGGIQIGVNTGVRASVFANYPKDLVRLAWQGNGDYVGQTLSVAPDLQAFAYNEIGLSAAFRVKDKIQVGGRLKYLIGLADFSLTRNDLRFYTDEEYYQLSLLTDVQFNTSMIDLGEINSIDDLEQFEPEFSPNPTSGNMGFAADLGIVFSLNDRLSIAASVKDLGFISWTDQPYNYAVQGEVNFEGLDPDAISSGDEEAIKELVDSLTAGLDIQSTQETYRTYLPTEIYLSGTFSPIKSLRLGGLIHSTFYRGRRTSSVAISASKDLGSILSLGMTYATINKSYQNLGANLLLKLGPVHLYTIADNILAFVKPEHTRFLNARFGMNVAF